VEGVGENNHYLHSGFSKSWP